MLIKLIKHDLIHSAKPFLALGAIVAAIAVIFSAAILMTWEQQAMFAPMPYGEPFPFIAVQFAAAMMVVIPIITVILIAYFYRKSMFGRTGHLTLTVPVSRGTLLASKLAMSFVWASLLSLYAYLVGVGTIASMHIFRPNFRLSDYFDMLGTNMWINFSVITFAAIVLLFFCITLSQSTFANRHLHGVIIGIIGLVPAGLYTWAAGELSTRSMQLIAFNDTTSNLVMLTGLRYGRIVIGRAPWFVTDGIIVYRDVYIDIFFIAFTLAAAAIVIAATGYLLKRRISLQ